MIMKKYFNFFLNTQKNYNTKKKFASFSFSARLQRRFKDCDLSEKNAMCLRI